MSEQSARADGREWFIAICSNCGSAQVCDCTARDGHVRVVPKARAEAAERERDELTRALEEIERESAKRVYPAPKFAKNFLHAKWTRDMARAALARVRQSREAG